MVRIVITLGLIAFIVLVLFRFFYYKNVPVAPNKLQKLTLAGKKIIKVEVMVTPLDRSRGLSGFTSLPADQGMLFIFPNSDYHTFWMNGMKFPLDFIWIRDEKVIDMTENIPHPQSPLEAPHVVKPAQEVDMVLEVNAGFVARENIALGDNISLSKK